MPGPPLPTSCCLKTCFLNELRLFGIPLRLPRLLTAVAIAALGLTKVSDISSQMTYLDTYSPLVLTALDAELQSAPGMLPLRVHQHSTARKRCCWQAAYGFETLGPKASTMAWSSKIWSTFHGFVGVNWLVSFGAGIGLVVGTVVWKAVKVAAASVEPMSTWNHVAVACLVYSPRASTASCI